jgi:hypothetical protein
MRTTEVYLDRNRLEVPACDDTLLNESYVDVLERLDRTAQLRELMTVEVPRDAFRILADRKAFKMRANQWKIRAGAVIPIDILWSLVKSILDRSRKIEDVRGVEIAVLDGPISGMPDQLQYLGDEQLEGLALLVALASRETQSNRHPEGPGPCIVTCLPPGSKLKASVQLSVDLILEDADEKHEDNVIDCTFVGDPCDVVNAYDPALLWLQAHDDEERSQAVVAMVMRLAPSVNRPRYRDWRFGTKFIEIARRYNFLTQERRARLLLEQMAYTILGEPFMGSPRPLYEDEKRGKLRTRGTDSGRHRNIGAGERLNYWDCSDGSIEFGAACGQHDEQLLPE